MLKVKCGIYFNMLEFQWLMQVYYYNYLQDNGLFSSCKPNCGGIIQKE